MEFSAESKIHHLYWYPPIGKYVVYSTDGRKEWIDRRDAPPKWATPLIECYLIYNGERTEHYV